jgi:hypothetical protein
MFILPSRGRPHNINRFIAAYKRTYASSLVIVYVDADDPMLKQYQMIRYPEKVMPCVLSTRLGIGGITERAFQVNRHDSYYGFLADDVVPMTHEWDLKLIEAAGTKELAYPDDGIYHEAIATHPVIGGDLVRAVGFLSLQGCKSYYIDTFWSTLTHHLGIRHYLPDIVYQHNQNHHDQTATDKRDDWFNDEMHHWLFFNDPKYPKFLDDVRLKLGKLI